MVQVLISDADATAALARADALHTGLTSIVLEGGDLARIAGEVAQVLDVGVLFTTVDGREQAGHVTDDQRASLVSAGLLDHTGRLRTERIGAEGLDVGEGQVQTLRVAAGGTDLARLTCLRDHGRIAPDDVHALERAATVAALLITREAAVSAVENKYRGDFLRDLFLRRAGDAAYVAEHAATFGWDLQRPMVVVAAELDPVETGQEPPSSTQLRMWQERFASAWRQVAESVAPGSPSVDFSTEVVTLLPAEAPAELVERAVVGVRGDRGGGRRAFSVGVSRVARTMDELPDAYAQARRAVTIGRRVRGPASTTHFDQLGVHRLIALVPDAGELRAFADDVLGPLAGRDAEAAGLRETLQVLLDTNFNVAEAARLQFFHYNTMRYRVGKLERMLGPLSSDPLLRLDVAVALRILEISY